MIRGHVIDVSWAVVQRSQGTFCRLVRCEYADSSVGFLDGGDRTVVLSNQSPSSSPAPAQFDVEPFSPLVPCSPSPIATPVGSLTPPIVTTSDNLGSGSALLVTNLPAALFSSDSDLHPLFCPYGEVKSIKRLPGGSNASNEGTISVIVEYQSSDQAREARDMLHGQAYANQPLNVDYMNPAPAPRSALDQWDAAIADVKARLNPNAAPFSMHGIFGQDISNRTSPFAKEQGLNVFEPSNNSKLASGLVGNPYQSNVPTMMPRSLSYSSLCPPSTGYVRPNSAPGRYVMKLPL